MKFFKIFVIIVVIFSTSSALNTSGSLETPLATVEAAFSSNIPERVVEMVNTAANGFKASLDFVHKVTINTIRGFLGIDPNCSTPTVITKAGDYITNEAPKDAKIPSSFSTAQNWPECKEIIDLVPNNPMNESICWALTFAKTLTDRMCIISDGKIQVEFSPLYIVECCKECYIMSDDRQEIPMGGPVGPTVYKSVWWGSSVIAWTYLLDHGIVSGGFTNQSEEKGCLPLTSTTKLETPRKKTLDQCGKGCSKTDGSRSPQPYKDELEKYKPRGKIFTITSKDVKQIQLEIMQNGPVQAFIQLHDDFFLYADGVYKHINGNFNGNHTVVITGWGVEETEPYWEVTNVWGTKFGKAGKMKILRGQNTIGIESEIVAGRLEAGSIGASPTNVDRSSSTTDKGLSPTERSGSNPVTIPFHKMSILLTTTFLVFL